MVLKLKPLTLRKNQFENDVKMYGTQTRIAIQPSSCQFENDVKMYGTQTYIRFSYTSPMFENDVKMYGTQTLSAIWITYTSLRMM